MFRKSIWVRWAPDYFRGQPRHKRMAATNSAIRPGAKKRTRPQNLHRRGPFYHDNTVSSIAYVRALSSSYPAVLREREHLLPFCEKAHGMVESWETAKGPSATSEESASHNNSGEAFLRFSALREVLSPLALALPQPPAHMRHATKSLQPHHGDASPKKAPFRVVPDDVLSAAVATEKLETRAATSPVTPFSLEELVTLLALYDAAQCEDGDLLLRLLGEVHRFFHGNLPAAAAARAEETVTQPLTSVSLPLPRLLLVLSRLGLSTEPVLQVIIRRSPGRDGSAGLLYNQLPRYSFAELVFLVVGLHRFGLHQDHAFKAVTQTMLRCHIFRSRSALSSFNGAVSKAVKAWGATEKRAHHRTTAASSVADDFTQEPFTETEMADALRFATGSPAASTSNASSQTVFDTLPPLDASLRMPPELLVEALTAVSLSLFRQREVVRAMANLLIGSAVAELTLIANGPGKHSAEGQQVAMTALAHQLLRGVKLCEQMGDPQVLLAACFAFTVDLAKTGVIADGGEDADVPSERRAYYDHVTADLIKVNRSL